MRKARFLAVTMIVSSLLLGGCFNENKADKGTGVELLRSGSNVEFISNGKYLGEEISINKNLSANEITPKEGVTIALRNNGNNTIVGIVKIGSEINKGDSLFFINSENIVEATLVDSVDNEKIESVKKTVRATGTNVLLGDFNGDKVVNMLDFSLFKTIYGKMTPTASELALYDIAPAQKGTDAGWTNIYSKKTGDAKIDIIDFVIFSINYSKAEPVEITPKSIEILGVPLSPVNVATTLKLTATVTYSNNTSDSTGVVWSSSDSTIVSVSADGVVTGVKAGTANITATKGTISKSVTIVVLIAEKTVTNITVAGATSVEAGSKITLIPTVTYSDNTSDSTGVTWSSSNTSIATIDSNGAITGVKAGTVVITITKGGVTKTIVITITEKVKTVSTVTITGETTVEKGKTITLTPTITYSDSTTDTVGVTWTSSDTTVATVASNGVVTALKAGKTNITASKDAITSAIKEVTVTEIITTFSGIKLHFKKPTAWTGVFIHYWATTGATGSVWASCPAMTDEGNGWYSYIIDGASVTNALFKDKTGETSTKTADQTAIKSGEHWFDGTTWTDSDPTDNIPPTVSITKPLANATVTGNVEVTANAQDNKAVDKVEFYLGTKLIGTAKASPYTVQWDSAYATNGAGVLKAVAFDKAGNVTTSAPINVTLSNANVAPVAIATNNLVALAGTEVEFDATASYDNGSIVSYVWDNGLTGVTAKKVYPTVGDFTVKLTVTDDGGLTSTTSISVKIVDKIDHRDFREETVYFMMTDRFADGNTTNNNIWGDEYLPGGASQLYNYDEDKTGLLTYYHGGDFDGIIKNLDYIKDMGFTAIWITPVVKQPEGRRINAGGTYSASAFHGYWAYDFDKIDPHLTSSGKDSDGWADFDKLVAAMHAKGMKLMLDIVVNHGHPADSVKGSASKWADKWNKVIMDGKEWTYDKTADPLVDASNPQTGFFSYAGTGNTWLIDLIDFNGNGPAENNAMPHLKNVYKRFIDHGVDAFRIDTVAYMSKANWADFTDEMYNYAKSKGNDYFYMIGEAWTGDRSGINNAMDLIYGGKHFNMLDLHNASMDFPGWMGNVFKGDRGFEDANVQKIYGPLGDLSGIYDPTYLGTFVDNHDVFRANGILNETQYKNNLNYIFLFRGVPIVYYGTEAMYSWPKVPVTTNKEDVCARWMLGDEGINYVKTNKPTMYKHIKMLNALRRDSEVLRKGQQTNLVFTGTKAVIKRVFETQTAYIGMSIGAAFTETVTGLENGTYTKYTPDSASGTFTKTTITVSGGTATLEVPANSFVIIQK